MDPGKNVMIIDDEMDLCLLMKNYLIHRQYKVHYALTLKEGIDMMDSFHPDILFLDNNLPDGIGWKKAKDILEQYPGISLYLMSGYQPNLPEDLPADKFKVIQKPISFSDLEFLNRNSQV